MVNGKRNETDVKDTGKTEATGGAREAPSAPQALFGAMEQVALLRLARESIVAQLAREKLPALPPGPDMFRRKLGCFVSLHKKGELRGCIGNIVAVYPLAEGVQRNALSAAFEDSRFSEVTAGEMPDIDIEISVLTEPREVRYRDAADLLQQLRPGVDGVVLSQGLFRRSTYLPQVWSQLPDKRQFLSNLCRKGGMPANAWEDPARTKVEVYQAFVFGEH
jgi:AmmeMemoRadiSam system protein A